MKKIIYLIKDMFVLILKNIFPKIRINKQIIIRMFADVILVNLSLIMSFLIRFLYEFIRYQYIGYQSKFNTLFVVLTNSFELYLYSAPIITLISIFIFYINGFYTKNRGYRGRYKLLTIFRAVLLLYLIYMSLYYFVPIIKNIPRSVVIISWFLTLLFVGGARFLVVILRRTGIAEITRETRMKKKFIENVLVIGGAGYIGSGLCRKLLNQGYNVRVLDSLLYGDQSISPLYKNSNFELVKGDFRNISDLVNAFHNIDAVIHLGAIVGDPACSLDDKLTLEINLFSTRLICEVAKGYGVSRFVFASTCSVYGASDSELLTEKSFLKPVSLYADSKIKSEKIILEMADQNFHPVIFRLATVFGLSYRPRFDLSINIMTAKAYYDKKVSIFGGDQWRPFVHVSDVADAFIKSLEKPVESIHAQIYNIGTNDNNYQICELGDFIKNVYPDVSIDIIDNIEDKRNYRVSFNKFYREFNLNSFRKPITGIKEIHYALSTGVIKDYKDPSYNNYNFLSDDINLYKLKSSTSLTHIKKHIETNSTNLNDI